MTDIDANTEQMKLLLNKWVSVYICTIQITVLTKYKINNINNTKINAFWVRGQAKALTALSHKALDPFSHSSYISLSIIFIHVFFNLSFNIYFLHLEFPPTSLPDWPTTDQPSGPHSQSGAGIHVSDGQWWGQSWKVTETKVSSSSAQTGHSGVCVSRITRLFIIRLYKTDVNWHLCKCLKGWTLNCHFPV